MYDFLQWAVYMVDQETQLFTVAARGDTLIAVRLKLKLAGGIRAAMVETWRQGVFSFW